MRNLTIIREKSFVGCLAKMKIYIEDRASGEIHVNGTPCRKIGDLKNGEEKTFQVTEEEAKVFVIADQLSKDYCNEYYQLPAGQEDLFLVGKNKFNPAAGYASSVCRLFDLWSRCGLYDTAGCGEKRGSERLGLGSDDPFIHRSARSRTRDLRLCARVQVPRSGDPFL